MSEGERTMDPWKILGWIFDALGALALGFCIWMATEITDLKVWRAETAGNRFTAGMQADYASRQAAEISGIWREMANMKTEWLREINAMNLKLTQLPQTLQVPPKWWEDYVRGMLSEHGTRIKELEQQNKKGTP
jgi:hypothetical protein